MNFPKAVLVSVSEVTEQFAVERLSLSFVIYFRESTCSVILLNKFVLLKANWNMVWHFVINGTGILKTPRIIDQNMIK